MSGFTLKIIAMLTMVVDHIGLVFFPEMLWMRIIGRISFPLFAFAAAEGARYTHDRQKYLTRLLLWGVIAEVPFDLMCHQSPFFPLSQNVCFTLAAGVACIYLLEKASGKNLAIVFAILLTTFLIATDYSFVGVLSVVIIHRYASQGKAVKGVAYACLLLSMMFTTQVFSFLALIPLLFYNGKPGKRLKYLFYIFYPLHMFIIWAVWAFMNTTVK
ncbi:MAG: TraX family protein [Angelakisella sp.]